MLKIKKVLLAAMLSISFTFNSLAEEIKTEVEKKETKSYPRMNASIETGFLAVLDHKIQFSKNNTMFDYKEDGGQDVLFPISKFTFDLDLDPTNRLVFLYQPLQLSTRSVLENDIKQDNVNFPKGTAMGYLYDFPFFRASYLYDFNKDDFEELSVGISLQLRNATIEFQSLDGEKLISKRNVGPVPILKFRSRNKINDKWWYGSDIDGFYAPVSYLNGSTNEVIGAILDANLKFGANLNDKYYPYLNLRYITGGGVGQSDERENLSDGFTDNWLHFLVLSVGINTDIF